MLKLVSLLLVFTSFLAAHDEKSIQQLHQKGERALLKGAFEEARATFTELLTKIDVSSPGKYSVDWKTYVDTVLRAVEADLHLGMTSEAKQKLQQLLKRSVPQELIPKIKFALARLKTPQEAYQELNQSRALLPQKYWEKEMVSFYRALEYTLDELYDSYLQRAKRFMACGLFREAIDLYRQVLEAIEKRCYPKANLPSSVIEKKVRYKLAEAYFAQAQYRKVIALSFIAEPVEQIDKEILYLTAMAYREEKEYEKALSYFQKACGCEKREDSEHYLEALFETACHFYQEKRFLEATDCFETLMKENSETFTPLATLYLSKLYLNKGQPERAAELLKRFAERAAHPEMYFLQGEAAYLQKGFREAASFYKQALKEGISSKEWLGTLLFHLGWSEVALNAFQEAEHHFEQLLEKEQGLLSLAYLLLTRQKEGDCERAKTLIKNFSFPTENILLLRGVIASHLDLPDPYFVEAPLKKAVSLDPSTKEYAYFTLGLFYYRKGAYTQAKEAFEQLEEESAEVLFWKGEILEKLGNDTQKVRRAIFQKYPNCPYADDAYFKFFQEKDYQEGHLDALKHLEKLPALFPKSPHVIEAYYWMGMHETRIDKKSQWFEKGLEAFQGQNNSVYYRTLYELASLYLEKDIPRGLRLLKQLDTAIGEPSTVLRELWEKALFALALGNLKLGKELTAQNALMRIVDFCRRTEHEGGYYCALAWGEQGKLAMKYGDFETALACFEIAEMTGKRFLSEEERLNFLILHKESELRKKKQDTNPRRT